MTQSERQIHYRDCHLCEATCGIRVEVEGEKVLGITGDKEDPVSKGHICPKAFAIQDIHEDPDRLQRPVKRIGDRFEEISWDEALDAAAEGLLKVRQKHGDNGVGFYLGNPGVHNIGIAMYAPSFIRATATRNRFSASSVDQMPQQLVNLWMHGQANLTPIPDLDHTSYLLMLGCNPLASNGSMMTVPGVRTRLRGILDRGGKLVHVDPRRNETARMASEHLFIKPGTDFLFLGAVIHTMMREDLVAKDLPEEHLHGLDTACALFHEFTPERAARYCGIGAEDIRRITREFCAAPSAICYGRMGTATQEFGALVQWAVQLVNLLSGNLDKVGGVIASDPALSNTGGRGGHFDIWRSRVSGLPEFNGELPAVTMAEEITTPGEGQIRGFVTIGGNPVLSTPNGTQLADAFDDLEFMVSLDIYINETSRHADIILPSVSPLERFHYDFAFYGLSIHNKAKISPPVFAAPENTMQEWEILNELTRRYCEKAGTEPRLQPAPEMIVDFAVQAGPYGGEGPLAGGLKTLQENPSGVDLGPLKPGFIAKLRTEDQKIQCAPPLLVEDLQRIRTAFPESGEEAAESEGLLLIGRRHLLSNNSWMHNYGRLMKGADRCTAMMHPDDISRYGLQDGGSIRVTSRVGAIEIVLEGTPDIMPGVISIPHGYGHDRQGSRLGVASRHAGVSVNDLTDEKFFDALSGNAAVNGIPVNVAAL